MSDLEQDKDYQLVHKALQQLDNEQPPGEPAEEPPEQLDALIMQAAQQALVREGAEHSAKIKPESVSVSNDKGPAPGTSADPGIDTRAVKRAWYVPLSYVAILVISLSVVMKLVIEPQVMTPQDGIQSWRIDEQGILESGRMGAGHSQADSQEESTLSSSPAPMPKTLREPVPLSVQAIETAADKTLAEQKARAISQDINMEREKRLLQQKTQEKLTQEKLTQEKLTQESLSQESLSQSRQRRAEKKLAEQKMRARQQKQSAAEAARQLTDSQLIESQLMESQLMESQVKPARKTAVPHKEQRQAHVKQAADSADTFAISTQNTPPAQRRAEQDLEVQSMAAGVAVSTEKPAEKAEDAVSGASILYAQKPEPQLQKFRQMNQQSQVHYLNELYRNKQFTLLKKLLLDYRKRYPLGQQSAQGLLRLPENLLTWERKNITDASHKQ